ncbi:MAG: alanine racemase [candidate division NC10 bacterium]|nr:alanine racemase [candidate division NC10 bacterium]
MRPTQAIVDLDAIAHNIQEVKIRVGPSVKVMAVVKADGYGHGALEVARTALEAGASWLGVALPEEGAKLRVAGITAPILVLGPTSPTQAGLIVGFGLAQTLTTWEQAQALSQEARSQGRDIGVHLKVDTGMGRIGVAPAEALGLAKKVARLPALRLEGAMTHFADADSREKGYARAQLQTFLAVIAELTGAGIPILYRHAANSAAILDLPEAYLDLVRPGIMIYGYYPSAEVSRSLKLRPALTLRTEVACLKEVLPGTSVSYGRTFVTSRRTRVATLPIGYADGYSRLLSNSGEALIHGCRVPVIGRVCMDMIMVDVTEIPQVCPGDEAVLYGRQGETEISVEEVAAKIGTISYEVVCAISQRVPRVYVGGGLEPKSP